MRPAQKAKRARLEALYQAAIWVVWRNYVKSRSENRRDDPPAVALGLIAKRLEVREILGTRLFPERAKLGPWLTRCYAGRIPTRRLRRNRVHDPVFVR